VINTILKDRARGGIRRARRLLQILVSLRLWKSQLPSNGEFAVIHLNRLAALRDTFVLQILRLLRSLGYAPIFYVSSFKELLPFATFSESVLCDYDALVSLAIPAKADRCVLVSDQEGDPLRGIAWQKVLNVEFDLSRPKYELRNPFYVPFPDRSIGWLENEIKANRTRKKKIRVLFSGSYRGYAGNGIQTYLGKMEREAIVRVFKRFSKTRVVASSKDLDALMSDDTHEPYCCFVDTDQFRIPQDDWFFILGQADIFLCPPGVVHPFCHNSVEAMAVGTIPLVNYAEWFHPRLTPNVNCLTFSDKADLVAKLEWAVNASRADLEPIQAAAQTYYDTYLDHEIFVHRLKEQTVNDRQVDLVITTEIADFLPRLTPQSVAFG
jgi:hypothetical protein